MEFVKFKRAVHAQFNQLAAGADMRAKNLFSFVKRAREYSSSWF